MNIWSIIANQLATRAGVKEADRITIAIDQEARTMRVNVKDTVKGVGRDSSAEADSTLTAILAGKVDRSLGRLTNLIATVDRTARTVTIETFYRGEQGNTFTRSETETY